MSGGQPLRVVLVTRGAIRLIAVGFGLAVFGAGGLAVRRGEDAIRSISALLAPGAHAQPVGGWLVADPGGERPLLSPEAIAAALARSESSQPAPEAGEAAQAARSYRLEVARTLLTWAGERGAAGAVTPDDVLGIAFQLGADRRGAAVAVTVAETGWLLGLEGVPGGFRPFVALVGPPVVRLDRLVLPGTDSEAVWVESSRSQRTGRLTETERTARAYRLDLVRPLTVFEVTLERRVVEPAPDAGRGWIAFLQQTAVEVAEGELRLASHEATSRPGPAGTEAGEALPPAVTRQALRWSPRWNAFILTEAVAGSGAVLFRDELLASPALLLSEGAPLAVLEDRPPLGNGAPKVLRVRAEDGRDGYLSPQVVTPREPPAGS